MDKNINEDFEKYYNIIQQISKGSFGEIYLVEKKNNTNEKRAIKIFRLKEVKENFKMKYCQMKLQIKWKKIIIIIIIK